MIPKVAYFGSDTENLRHSDDKNGFSLVLNSLVLWQGLTPAYADTEDISDEEIVSLSEVGEIRAANIYPNPIRSTTATVSFDFGNGSYSFAVYSLAGVRILEVRNITIGEFTFDRENLRSGIYFYRLRNERNDTFSGKIMVR